MNEEKERYTWFGCGCCVDNQDNLNIVNCIERLNQQDARIKELETCLDKVINDYKNLYNDLFIKNQQLKQSQKQLAIKELEKLRPLITRQAYICGGKATENEIVEANAYNRCLEDIRDILHNQIKQLEAQNEV